MTSKVIEVLQPYMFAQNVGLYLNLAREYLLQQQVSGSWASNWETAAALLAVVPITTDSSRYAAAVIGLRSVQLGDGSWDVDTYTTALVIRALYLIDNLQVPVDPVKGSVIGVLVDNTNNQPISGANITILELPAVLVNTDSSGNFLLDALDPGQYTILFSSSGYFDRTATVTVNQSQILNIGSLSLQQVPTTGIVAGQVTDAGTGAAISGATVTVGAIIATTSSDGAFSMVVMPGTFTVTISATGYTGLTGTATVIAGNTLTISPALIPIDDPNTPPTTANLSGTVVDADGQSPLSGVLVQLVGTTLSTNSAPDGSIQINDITPGDLVIELSLTGYQTVQYSAVAFAGGNIDLGTVQLVKINAAIDTTVFGTVTAASDGAPVSGAMVVARWSNQAADQVSTQTAADGTYSLSGIPVNEFDFSIQAVGYIGDLRQVNSTMFGTFQFDSALQTAVLSGLEITDISLNSISFGADTKIPFSVGMSNSGTETQQVRLAISIINDFGVVVDQFDDSSSTGNTDPLANLIAVDPGASVNTPLEWNTQQHLPGTYKLFVQIFEPVNSVILSERSSTFSILSTQVIGGSVKFDPPITQLASKNPVQINAKLTNNGNQFIGASTATATVRLSNAGYTTPPDLLEGSLLVSDGGLNRPQGIDRDDSGNIYVANTDGGNVLKITPSGTVTELLSGLNRPVDIDLDGAGNIYVAEESNRIVKLSVDNISTNIVTGLSTQSAIEAFADGRIFISSEGNLYQVSVAGVLTPIVRQSLANPHDIVVDAQGTVYIANTDGNSIEQFVNGRLSTFASNIPQPYGLALDDAGQLYATSYSTNSLIKIAPDGTTTTVTSSLAGPYDVTLAPDGDLVVSNYLSNEITKVTLAGQVTPLVMASVNQPRASGFDDSGNLFVANQGDRSLTRFDLNGSITRVNSTMGNILDMAISGSGDTAYVLEGAIISSIDTSSGTRSLITSSSGTSPIAMDLTTDGTGLLVSDAANVIHHVDFSGLRNTYLEASLDNITSMRSHADGNQYVLSSSGYMARIQSNGEIQRFATNLGHAFAMAVNPAGGFYVADYYGRRILTVDESGSEAVFANLSIGPANIAVNSNGTILVAGLNGTVVNTVDSSGQLSTYATVSNAISGDMLVDDVGQLWLTHSNRGLITRISTDGTQTVYAVAPLTSSLSSGLVSDGQGGVYVSAYARVVHISNIGIASAVVEGGKISNERTLGISRDANGRIWLAYGNGFLASYSSDFSNEKHFSALKAPNGISSMPSGEVIVVNTGNQSVLRLVGPNILPEVIARGYFSFVKAVSNNQVLLSSGTAISHLDTNTLTLTTLASRLKPSESLAVAADGQFATTSELSDTVLRFSANGMLLDQHIGLVNPKGLAFKPNGQLAIVSSKLTPIGGSVLIADENGRITSKFIDIGSGEYIYHDSSGDVLVSHLRGINRYSPSGLYKQFYRNHNAYLNPSSKGVAGLSDGSVISTSTFYGALIQYFNDRTFKQLATGLAGITDIESKLNDNLLVTDNVRNTVSEIYKDGSIELIADNLTNARSLAVAQDGTIYVAHNADLSTIDSQKNVSLLDSRDIVLDNIEGVVAGPGKELFVSNAGTAWNGSAFSLKSKLYQLQSGVGSPDIIPGDIVFSKELPIQSLSLDGSTQSIDFGSWLPEVSGDYEVTIQVSSVTETSVKNTLHVGPEVDGVLTLEKNVIEAGDQLVASVLQVKGADSTNISVADSSGASSAGFSVYRTNQASAAMVADSMGNIFIIAGQQKILKYGVDGVAIDFAILDFSNRISYGLAIDSKDNLYTYGVRNGINSGQVYRIDPQGVVSLVADLGSATNIHGIATDYNDILYVVTTLPSGLFRINTDGTSNLVTESVGPTPAGLTIDKNGNYYIVNGTFPSYKEAHSIIRVTPEANTSTYNNRFRFEFEGINVTADCSNNILFAPIIGGREEDRIMQLVGDTGEVRQVFYGPDIDPSLTDMDVLFYDRSGQRLLIWQDYSGGSLYSLPVVCGSIDTEVHLITRADVELSGFDPAPTSVLTRPNGTREFIWILSQVNNQGKNIRFNSLFRNMDEGETRNALADAYLLLNNSFAPSESVRMPIDIPGIQALSGLSISTLITGGPFTPNTEVPITVDLNNSGSTPFNGQVQLSVVDANGALVTSLAPIDIVNLPTATNTLINTTWNTGTTINGNYIVETKLLNSAGVQVATGDASFTISSGTTGGGVLLFDLRTYLDKQIYHTTDQVIISSLLQNKTANTIVSSASVEIIVTDSAGTNILTSSLSLNSDFVPGATRTLSTNLGLVNNAEGPYTVTSRLLNSTGTTLATGSTSFTVTSNLEQALSASVVVAVTTITGGNNQTCTATLINNGVNAITALDAHFILTDITAGTQVSDEITPISLAVGAQTTLTRTIDTTGVPEHDYACLIQISVNGANKTLGYAAYTVIPAAYAAVTLALDRPVYHTTDTVTIIQAINNITVSTPVAGASLQTEILDSANQVVFTFNNVLATFNAGTSLNVVVPYTYINNTAGTYRAIARVMSNAGVELATTEQVFTIRNMIAESLTASLALGAPEVQAGNPQTCIATLTNTGYFNITNLDVTHRIVNASGSIITSNPYQISLAQNQGTTLTLNQATNNLAIGAYRCLLLANIAGTLTPLASASFAVIPPPISLDGELTVGDRGRLLILLDSEDDDEEYDSSSSSSSSSSHDSNGGPTLAEQRTFIEQLLADNGWSFTIAEEATVFETEFHNGGYQAYMLLGEDGKLPEQTQTALREAVFRGEGLIVAGNHDNRNTKSKKLNDALGIKLAGKISDATGLAINTGPLAENGATLTLPTGEKVMRIKLKGATTQALYLPNSAGQSDDCDDSSSSSSASSRSQTSSSSSSSDEPATCQQALTAMTSHDYGRGRGVYAGFDLLANATLDSNNSGSPSTSAQLILDALTYSHPALITETAGGGLPLQLTVSNRGVAADVRASIMLPPAVTVIDAADATQTTDPAGNPTLNWNLLLQANMQATWLAWIQLPEVVGPLSLNATIEGALPNTGIYQLLAQPSLALTVLAAPIPAEVDGLLANLETNGIGDANRIKQARKSLDKASQNLPDNPDKAFREALKAADSLSEAGSHPDINAARIMLGQWLWELARQLPVSSGESS